MYYGIVKTVNMGSSLIQKQVAPSLRSRKWGRQQHLSAPLTNYIILILYNLAQAGDIHCYANVLFP